MIAERVKNAQKTRVVVVVTTDLAMDVNVASLGEACGGSSHSGVGYCDYNTEFNT